MAPDDAALWHSWIDRRDEAAFTALVTEHLGFATGLARRLGCSAADADDVTQRALVRLAGETREKPANVGIRAWLGRDVLHEWRKSARSRARRIKYEGKAPARMAEGLEAVDVRDAVQAALATLDEGDRLAVELRFLHDLEYRDVAFILGCSRLACRLRVHRAVKGMRRRLGRDASLIVASWPHLSDTPPDAGARIGRAITASRTAVPASTTLVVLGGILVGKKMIAVAAGLLLLLGGVSYVFVAGDGDGRVVVQERPPVALAVERSQPPLASHPVAARPEPANGAAAAAVASVGDPTKGALEVRVLARDGTVIPDEPFSVDPRRGSGTMGWRFSRTGADGVGRIAGLEPGEVSVYSGHGPLRHDVVVAAGSVAQADIRLPRGVDVDGVVVDADGSPVGDAEVWIDYGDGRGYGMLAAARTQSNGSFALKDVETAASVSARADGHAPSPAARLQLGAGGTEIVRLVLGGPGASVRGRVVDAAGAPVAGALVEIGAPTVHPKDLRGVTWGAYPRPFLTFTADDGTFSADGLPVGRAFVTVRALGYGPYRADRDLVVGPPPNEMEIALAAGVALERVVVDEAGSTVEGAWVSANCFWGYVGGWRTKTDAQGRFRLADLPSEQSDQLANLFVGHEEKGHAALYAHVGNEATGLLYSSAPIVLQPYLRIRVRVVDEHGAPIAGHEVAARTPKERTPWTSRTDADGRATFRFSDGGMFEVSVLDPEGDALQPMTRLRDVRPGPDEVTLTVRERDRPTAKILGRLTVPGGRLPDGARVWATRYGGTLDLSVDAATGGFASRRIQPGRYDVRVMATGLGNAVLVRSVRVAAGQTLDLGDIQFDPPGSLVVRLKGADELVRSRGVILAECAAGRIGARVEPDGTARIAALAPGPYRLSLQPWFVTTASVVIEPGRETSVDLTATPGHARRIRVQGLGPDHIRGLTIKVVAEGERTPVWWAEYGDVVPVGDPDIRVAFLPGQYVAEAQTADGRRASVSFEVRGDGEPPVVVGGLE